LDENTILSQDVYRQITTITKRMIKKFNILDEEEALSTMNEVIAMAYYDWKPDFKVPFIAYAVICIRRRLINFIKQDNKFKRQVEIHDHGCFLETFGSKKLTDDPSLYARINDAIKNSRKSLTKRQCIIMDMILDGASENSIIDSLQINKSIMSREKRKIINKIKENL